MKRFILSLFLSLCALPAFAQNTLNFAVGTITGDGSLTTSVTWSTTPAATSCTATGASQWTGTKAASGSEQLTLTSSATLNMACTWPGDSIAQIQWTNPTMNTDGSPYTDPKFVRLMYTFGATAPTDASVCGGAITCVDVPQTPTLSTMRTITGIATTGTMRVAAKAINMLDKASTVSNAVTKVFTGVVTVNRSVGITVNPVPSAPTGLTVN